MSKESYLEVSQDHMVYPIKKPENNTDAGYDLGIDSSSGSKPREVQKLENKNAHSEQALKADSVCLTPLNTPASAQKNVSSSDYEKWSLPFLPLGATLWYIANCPYEKLREEALPYVKWDHRDSYFREAFLASYESLYRTNRDLYYRVWNKYDPKANAARYAVKIMKKNAIKAHD